MTKQITTTVLLGLLVLVSATAFGQREDLKEDRLQQAKREFLSERLSLSDEQEERFFQLYGEYHEKRRDIRIDMSQNRMELRKSSISESEAMEVIDNELQFKSDMVELERVYMERFTDVLGPRGVLELYKAEDDFRKVMMQRLRDRNRGR